MQDTKAIKLLQCLTPEEFLRLGKFLRSPFYNYTPIMVQLYEHLRRYHPAFGTKKLEKEKVWAKLFPGMPFNDNKYWNICFSFAKLVEKYLAVMQLEANPNEEKKLLIKSLGDRNVYDLFEKETKGYLQKLDAEPYRDAEYFSDKTQLNTDYFFHPMTQKLTLKDDALVELMDSIDQQFVLMKLRMGSELKNRERTLSKNYEIKWMDMVLDEERRGSTSGNTTAMMYRILFDLYKKDETHGAYFHLKNTFEKHIGELRRWDQSMMVTQLINYAVRQINSGNELFYKEAFEIYKIRLENGLVVENERINEADFGNIVILGCRAKEFVWVKGFIEKYKMNLDEGIRENEVALNTGLWYFHQNQFEQAYDLFANFSYSHFYQPKARVNLIRTLFEQFLRDRSLYDLLVGQLESFEKFIYRSNVLTLDHKKANLNFVTILKKFAKGIFIEKGITFLKEFLTKEISGKKRIVVKDWLINKTENL